jgi:hypothetical protein
LLVVVSLARTAEAKLVPRLASARMNTKAMSLHIDGRGGVSDRERAEHSSVSAVARMTQHSA